MPQVPVFYFQHYLGINGVESIEKRVFGYSRASRIVTPIEPAPCERVCEVGMRGEEKVCLSCT